MTPSASNPEAAPLPPLPNLSGGGGSAATGAGGQSQSMAALVSGLAPVKSAVDTILAAVKQIVQSGAVPGFEQIGGQIVALATSALPMAAQQAMNPMGGGPPSPPPQQGIPPVGAGGAPPQGQ